MTIRLILTALLSFTLAAWAAGPPAPPTCDSQCRDRDTFYDWNLTLVFSLKYETCDYCVAGNCQAIEANPPPVFNCVPQIVLNQQITFWTGGSPACPQGGNNQSEAVTGGANLGAGPLPLTVKNCGIWVSAQ